VRPATACACSTGWWPTITSAEASGLLRAAGGAIPRIRLAGAAMPAALPIPRPADAEFIAPEWIRLHAEAPRAAFDLAMLGPMRARLAGPGLVWHGGALLDDESVMPVYVRRIVQQEDGAMPAHLAALPVRRETRPGFVFHGWGVRVYGHLLIEMLPKLLLAIRFLSLLDGVRPVLDREMPDWFIAIMRDHFGVDTDEAIWYDSAREQLDLDHAIILPLLGRTGGYHPLTGGLIDHMLSRIARPPAMPMERIFVARGDFANPHAPQRRYANEDEIAAIARDEFGFAVLRPETLPFAEQMGLFAGARAIVGPMGSGLHNAIFAGPDCVTGVIRCHALDQSAIAALRGQRIGLLSEGIHETAPQAYTVEPDRFRRFLAALLQS
jgi:hypothetical protein